MPFVLLLAAVVLLAAAWLRGAEYDEQYTLFLTGGETRPVWPQHAFAAGEVEALQSGHPRLATIARELRANDVHPPLYFWAVAWWRQLAGPSLYAARLLSVLCGVLALGLVTVIARRLGIPGVTAALLTLGCYGFAYTSVVARAFSLAQLLILGGVALLLHPAGRLRSLLAGGLFGAAMFTNYLASFVGFAALLWLHAKRIPLSRGAGEGRGGGAWTGFALWLPPALWFFLPQRQNRTGQFPPFDLLSSVVRLAHYVAASVFGGLPLYLHGATSSLVSAALAVLLLALLTLIIRRWRHTASQWLPAMCAVATPAGLLLLGGIFNNTPIELRYFAFATPFIALLLATLPRWVCCAVLLIQAVSLLGLMTRQETMQPARMTASAAATVAQGGVVLLPRGNDGVGIVGAFAIEAPPELRLLVIDRDTAPDQIRARVGHYKRVVLVMLAQDADSRATLPLLRQAFAGPCWRAAGEGFNVLAYNRICEGQN